mgnify:CR=1 FL=1
MKLLETVALSKQAMCLAVSPYVPGEAVVVTETGSVHSWRCGQELVTVCSATEQFNANCASEWYQCVFAGNPRCIALANPKAVHLVDIRARAMFKRFFFSIPSFQVDSFECINIDSTSPTKLPAPFFGHRSVSSTSSAQVEASHRRSGSIYRHNL